jgi:hypothetical protein
MATTFSADRSGWMLWQDENTNPPPRPRVSMGKIKTDSSKNLQ